MESIYFVKKNEDGNIVGTGQWHEGDGINYKGHKQVSKEEWDKVNKEIIAPKTEQLIINTEAKKYLASTDWYAVREQETGKAMPEDVKKKRAAERLKVE